MALFDLSNVRVRESVRRRMDDPLGLGVYQVDGQIETASGVTERPFVAVSLHEMFMSRVTVDLTAISSRLGCVVSLWLLAHRQCKADGWSELAKGSIVVPPETQNLQMAFCAAPSPWLWSWIGLTVSVNANDVRFATRWTFDRVSSGTTAYGEDVTPL